MRAKTRPLLGSQTPTYLWVPDHRDTLGDEAVALYEATGNQLDEWQKLAVRTAMALDPVGALRCFEVALILSRQNGKGEALIALELAWLFLFDEPLIIHSAHLFETSREHFLKMQVLVANTPDFERRVRQMKEGRGSEEIILKSGARLKFMTRKGGAGRGFTGGKVVLDEAMYLDATMMAASLPTMATRPDAQVIYAGSAGMKHSTQLAAVRRRGYQARNDASLGDESLALLEWAAEKAVYDEHGELLGGDDPADPRTWAKVNPAFGTRISEVYIRKEARALGGFDSVEFGTERLGIGDWPEDDERWEVIPKETWERGCDETSQMQPRGRVLAVDVDPETTVYTLFVSGIRPDGKGHLETVERHRGSTWVVPRTLEIFEAKGRRYPVVILRSGAAAHLAEPLTTAGVEVHHPTDSEYAQACQAIVEDIRAGAVVHIGQQSLTGPLGASRKRVNVEGGWKWDRDVPGQATVVCATLARWGVRRGLGTVPRSKVY